MLNKVKLIKITCLKTVVVLLLWGTASRIAEGLSGVKQSSAPIGSNYRYFKNVTLKRQLRSQSTQTDGEEVGYFQNQSAQTAALLDQARLKKPSIVSTRKIRDSDVLSPVQLSTLTTELHQTASTEASTVPQRYTSQVRRPVRRPAVAVAGGRATAQKLNVIVGVLLPFSGNRSFVIRKVAPAFERAVEKVTIEMGPWNFHR